MSTREVTLDGGSPWGFRMHGGADTQQPLRIARVNPGSKAAQRGIREGDLISSINGQSTRAITNSEAHALLKNAGDTLVLGLNQEPTGSPKRRIQKLSQDFKEDCVKRTNGTSTSFVVSNNITTNRINLSNSQQNNESVHTNGVQEQKETEEKLETISNFHSYINNASPSTNLRGATNDGQSRDELDDDTTHNHSSICRNESDTGAGSVTIATRDKVLLATTIMADNVCGSSRSRNKRKSRSNRKRSKKCNLNVHEETNIESNNTTRENYDDNVICESNLDNTVSTSSTTQTYENKHNSSDVKTIPEINNLNIVTAKDNDETNNITKTDSEKNCDTISKKLDSVIIMVSPDSDICIVEFPKTNTKTTTSVSIIDISNDSEIVTITHGCNNINKQKNLIDNVANVEKRDKSTETNEFSSSESCDIQNNEPVIKDTQNVKICDEMNSYKVEFPKPKLERKNSNNGNGIVKSRSLDDDDEQLKITELTDDEKYTSCMSETQAIVSEASEAESDVEWETTAELAMQKKTSGQQFGKLSIISLPLEEHVTYEPSHISPEDEKSLRDFLEGLNLVNSPEESVKRIEKTSTPNTETVKMKKAKKRAALAQHFLPYYQNPRYLDVISEEGSDLSDKDNKPSTSYRCQMLDTDDDDDDVFESRETKLRNKYQSHYMGTNDGAILVGTKLIDHKSSALKEGMWSTTMAEMPSGAEVVYLEDSSNSMTPSDLLDPDETTGDMDADDEEEISIDLDKSYAENIENEQCFVETSPLIKNNTVTTLSIDMTSRVSVATDVEAIKSETVHQLTPPTSTPSTSANDITTEEPLKPSNMETIDFLHRILTIVSNNNVDDILISLNDTDFQHLPPDMQNTLKMRALAGDQQKMIDEIKLLQNSINSQSAATEKRSSVINEDELNIELKNLCDDLNHTVNGCDEYSSQIDSTPNASRSGSAASSRSTSQCTALYNPLHSSLTNIAAMLREDSNPDDRVTRSEPPTLREICVRTLLIMPYGKDIIEELANVSQSIEEMTHQTPPIRTRPDTESVEYNNKSPPTPPLRNNKPDTDVSSVLLVDTPVARPTPPQSMNVVESVESVESERWIGMPTEENPNLLVCLSPSQKEFIEKTKTFPNEADSLLDLHRKYIERRGYHEDNEYSFPCTVKKDTPTVPAFKIKLDPQNNNNNNNNSNPVYPNVNYNNYIKQFTKEIPVHVIKSDNTVNFEQNMKNGNLRYDQYIKQITREVPIQVEKQINKPVNNKIYSAALSNDDNVSCKSRLNARHLGEWLNLARNECDKINNSTEMHIRQVHNLHSSVNKLVSQRSCEDHLLIGSQSELIRENSPRRYSLPFNLYEQQMQYILKKEREIEQEIEKLRKEKATLEKNDQTILKQQQHYQNDIITTQAENNEHTSITTIEKFNNNESNAHCENTELFKELSVTLNKNELKISPQRKSDNNEYIIPITKEEREINETDTQNKNIKYSNTKSKERIIPISIEKNSENINNKRFENLHLPIFDVFESESSEFQGNTKFTRSFQMNSQNLNETKSKENLLKEHIIPDREEFNLFTKQTNEQKNPTKTFGEFNNEHIIPVEKQKSDKNNSGAFKEFKVERIIPVYKGSNPSPSKNNKKSIKPTTYENTELFKELHVSSSPAPNFIKEKHVTTEHLIPIHKEFDAGKYQISRKGDIAILNLEKEKLSPKLCHTSTASEKFRQDMYDEYMCKIAERQERKQNKVLKIQISSKAKEDDISNSPNVKHVAGIEDEFMNKVREKKIGVQESDNDETISASETCEVSSIKIIDGSSMTETKQLPKHLREFIDYTSSPNVDDGVWSPGKSAESTPSIISRITADKRSSPPKDLKCDDPVPVIWTPRSAGSSPTAERKEFRPVNFESPTLGRKNKSKESTPAATPEFPIPIPPPWEAAPNLASTQEATTSLSSSTLERKLTTSHSAPVAGLNNLGKLPRAQNPTITLLQKAREGQLPRGASYIEDTQQNSQKPMSKDGRPPLIGPGEILYTVKNEYLSDSENEKPKKMADLGPRKFEGIGPTTKDGMPIVLRSEVKESNQAKWYKRMYDTLHRAKNDDEYVTVRYKTRRGRYPYTSAAGYLSEPEPNAYDSDASISASKYATLDRRRLHQPIQDKENEYITYTVPRNKYMSSASVKHSTDIYKNQPGRIENYVPGHSSISEKEAKEWWDEVMEIFDGHLDQQKHVPPNKSFMSHALKESGYESDSTLVFRRREDAALQLSPHEQKEAYKTIQKGGEVPLHGLRKPAPERPKEPVMGPTPPPKGQSINRDSGSESPRKYVEDEVTIHYRSPVRHEIKEAISEEELARKQAEAMRRIYQEERRRKYLQELQDMNSRRHTDNFIPSQKSPIPLNRYDDFIDDLSPKIKLRERSPEPRLVARALYNFVGQSSRELTFRKGDIIFIRRQVDKNWYEGEHNAMVGLFPSNYVEIIPYDGIKSTPRKAHEGQARAKFNFIAQTHLELSLAKGELVVLTRRVDDNWFEGRIGNRKGIFPVSYVEILIDPSDKQEVTLINSKPVASPAAHSLLLNGSAGGKESMGSHHYQPTYSTQNTTTTSYHHAKPVNIIGTTTTSSYQSITRTQKSTTGPAINEALHIDTHHSEPVAYRALYKYRPQNDDELELQEGDTVYVLEKCDDGWYVGSSQRTGAFGTFPGNYVERI